MAGCLKHHVQNGIIMYVVAPYYNLIIHRIEIFASMVHHGKNYSQKTEEWILKTNAWSILKPNTTRFWKKIIGRDMDLVTKPFKQ